MAGPDRDDLQARRDIRRAYALLGRLRGLNAEDSMAVLHDHAALTGVASMAADLAAIDVTGVAPEAEFGPSWDHPA